MCYCLFGHTPRFLSLLDGERKIARCTFHVENHHLEFYEIFSPRWERERERERERRSNSDSEFWLLS